jgi:hypothetical protein
VANDLAERHLALAWRCGLSPPLVVADGRALQIIYRGRCPGGAGPDVRGALLVFANGALVEGDVEFHQRASDWFGHGHHRDARYRSVVLHVVLDADRPAPPDSRGEPVPTLVLSPNDLAAIPLLDGTSGGAEECHRAASQRGSAAIVPILDNLGDRRLTQRAARFEADLTTLTAEQLVYESLFDALGFSRNRAAFIRLARAVPVELLAALLGRRPADEAMLLAEAILFGAAGLLPSQRATTAVDWEGDDTVDEIEATWSLYRGDWNGLVLESKDWVFGGVRPANYPTRRVATAARTIVRFRDRGLVSAILAPLRAGEPGPQALEGLFLVSEPDTYWSTHCDFGRPLPGSPAALLGRDRARDAVVNVVLPFALAVAATSDDRALADATWATYRGFPRPSSYQATESLATALGLTSKTVGTARRQQGLLHLVRQHCEGAGCGGCPLGESSGRTEGDPR